MSLRKSLSSCNLDLLGITLSFFCAIHCTLLPLLLAFFSITGLLVLHDPRIEYGVLLGSLMVAAFSIWQGTRKGTLSTTVLMLMIAGFILVITGYLEWIVFPWLGATVVGALLIAGGHLMNLYKSIVYKKSIKI
jgi:hypothetical protein